MEADTAALRKAAPSWSLAGDKQLLEMLQNLHQKIITKCEEANTKLDAMVDALDNASIDLQNVNNKFMALSNSQFVESRVYDDDIDISTEANVAKAEPPKMDTESEITKLKRSLQILEQMHEPVHILDSDSSDDEDNGRTILKPKQIYSHRPLPYIIGSQAWKSKWHAGLVQEESDSDSSVSKQDNVELYNDEYSESEPETAPTDKLANRTISMSSMESELRSQPVVTSEPNIQPVKPADVAAELARRLGGQPILPASEPVSIEPPPEPTTNKVYRVEKPAPTTIFSDEPPPLDDYQSYKSDYTDDDDIFAELHKKPYPKANKGQNPIAKNLFGGLSENIVDDLFGEMEPGDNDIGNIHYNDAKPSASNSAKPPLFNETPKSSDNSVPKPRPIETQAETEGAVKKPVGGISLFGNTQGAESIGAAILRRNLNKSSSSDEDTRNTKNDTESNIVKTNTEPANKLIEELFSKPLKKVTKKEETIKVEPDNVKSTKTKIDLFSDNLFEDIDDIFITNIVTKPKDSKSQKSIFDDDGLFSDITIKNPEKHDNKSDSKSIFDNNDGLFSENENNEIKNSSSSINVAKDDLVAEENVKVQVENRKIAKQIVSKSLFEDDSGDDLFSDINIDNDKTKKPNIGKNIGTETITQNNENNDSSANTSNKITSNQSKVNNLINSANQSSLESPSIFDDDEFDDLFSTRKKSWSEQTNLNNEEEKIEKPQHENVTSNKSDNVAGIRYDGLDYTKQLDNDLQSRNISINKIAVAETKKNNGLNETEPTQPKTNIGSYTNKEQERETKYSHITNLDDDSKKIEPPIHSATLHVNDDSSSSDLIPKTTDQSMINDLFTDMPPAFEKPLESKKSKNVNALFDDDSDDEALFFKKNEIISDEKPEQNINDRFRIFHDEPPEIDIDFSQKSLRNMPKSLSESDNDNLFEGPSTLQEQQIVGKATNVSIKEVNNPDDNYPYINDKMKEVVDISKLIEESIENEENLEKNVTKLHETAEIIKTISDKPVSSVTETFSNKDLLDETETRKSVGKLKPMNFNINVNTLLPGNVTSLKKSKVKEETDGQRISTQSNEELNIHGSEKIDSKMVKSVSFDGDPESEILDNKLSKQRAKIQVKRRPSSRRARLEAVRKSRIELASDSTDNSSSFDEPPYKEMVKKDRLENDTMHHATTIQVVSPTKNVYDTENAIADISKSTNAIISSAYSESLPKDIDTQHAQADVKSKVVYILNDEDIFSNTNPRKEENTDKTKPHSKENVGIVDDDDDELLFKTPNISTLGKTYEDKTIFHTDNMKVESKTTISKKNVQKSSENILPQITKPLFGDQSDDENELFGGSQKSTVQKVNIFDSDSDGELFAKSKREKTINVEHKKEIIKGSLFGDESGDDSDLFGVRANKTTDNAKQMNEKQKAKMSEPVFEDPLSMFGDDS